MRGVTANTKNSNLGTHHDHTAKLVFERLDSLFLSESIKRISFRGGVQEAIFHALMRPKSTICKARGTFDGADPHAFRRRLQATCGTATVGTEPYQSMQMIGSEQKRTIQTVAHQGNITDEWSLLMQ